MRIRSLVLAVVTACLILPPFLLNGKKLTGSPPPAKALSFTGGTFEKPRTWNKCEIPVWVGRVGAPKGVSGMVKRVLADINQFDGPRFVYRGRTTAAAEVWAVKHGGVVMGFASNKSAEFSRSPSALAVYRPTATNGFTSSGTMWVANNLFVKLPPDGARSRYVLLAHEFLHAAGFAHSTSEMSIMNPRLGKSATITPDVAALISRLALAGC